MSRNNDLDRLKKEYPKEINDLAGVVDKLLSIVAPPPIEYPQDAQSLHQEMKDRFNKIENDLKASAERLKVDIEKTELERQVPELDDVDKDKSLGL